MNPFYSLSPSSYILLRVRLIIYAHGFRTGYTGAALIPPKLLESGTLVAIHQGRLYHDSVPLSETPGPSNVERFRFELQQVLCVVAESAASTVLNRQQAHSLKSAGTLTHWRKPRIRVCLHPCSDIKATQSSDSLSPSV